MFPCCIDWQSSTSADPGPLTILAEAGEAKAAQSSMGLGGVLALTACSATAFALATPAALPTPPGAELIHSCVSFLCLHMQLAALSEVPRWIAQCHECGWIDQCHECCEVRFQHLESYAVACQDKHGSQAFTCAIVNLLEILVA
jgi:hypothetical protein